MSIYEKIILTLWILNLIAFAFSLIVSIRNCFDEKSKKEHICFTDVMIILQLPFLVLFYVLLLIWG